MRPLIFAVLLAADAMAQTPAFEVVSVKPLGPKDHLGQLGCTGERFESALPLRELLRWVFDVKSDQFLGIPDWDPRVMYDTSGLYRIDAVASRPVTEAECKAMVQQLLKDRYKMVAHREARETPVYALVVAKNGPKMARADENPSIRVIVNGNPMGIAAGTSRDFKGPSGWSMDRLADFLRIGVDRLVINRTGLEGLYKINLSFSSQGFSAANLPPEAGPEVMTALSEQLGLRLESVRAPIEMVVIDHIEKPDAN
jgi:bla regulator protein blaR1